MSSSENDEPMNLRQASEFLGGRISEENIRRALAAGEMTGRMVGGNVGWMTTRASVIEWIRRGNHNGWRTEVRTKAGGGEKDGTS